MIRSVLLLLSVGLVTGCTDFSQVDAAMQARGRETVYPVLLPIDTLLAAPYPPRLDADSGTRLAARAAALRAKAARLRRQPVLTRAERRRLIRAAKRHAA